MKSKVLALAILGCVAGSSNTAQANVLTENFVAQGISDFCSGYWNLHKRRNYHVGCLFSTAVVAGVAYLAYKKATENEA